MRCDLRGAGEKHSHSECKKCALGERPAHEKLDNLIHLIRSDR